MGLGRSSLLVLVVRSFRVVGAQPVPPQIPQTRRVGRLQRKRVQGARDEVRDKCEPPGKRRAAADVESEQEEGWRPDGDAVEPVVGA